MARDSGDGLIWHGRRVELAAPPLHEQAQEAFEDLLRLVARLHRADPTYAREIASLFATRLRAEVDQG